MQFSGGFTMRRRWGILVADDEEIVRNSLAAWLAEDGYAVDTAASGREAVALAGKKDYAIYFIDLKMSGGMDGIEAMIEIRKIHADASVVIITGFASVDTAISAMKEGAQEYIIKPCNPEEISLLVGRIINLKNLQRENTILRKKLNRQYSFEDIISKNSKMLEIFQLIREVASLRSTVLIEGESGTGKELIARAIHHSGNRAAKPFIGVSCAALAETLLESELFGHEKGAFTGAAAQKKGKFELADGGTIFLDEVGDISPKLQMDLLRVLQERCYYRVGGWKEVQVDARVIAATNTDLQEAVRKGKFRDDLYYRLNVINIRIPPLRMRREDIPLLARSFIEKISPELRKDVNDISEDALRQLLDHDWPGNVRELENAIERAIVTCKGRCLSGENFAFLGGNLQENRSWTAPPDRTLHEIEREVILATVRRTRGNIKQAAGLLGIDRSTLYDKLRKYRIADSEPALEKQPS
jgi:DNA-binding NtrC family response regulator